MITQEFVPHSVGHDIKLLQVDQTNFNASFAFRHIFEHDIQCYAYALPPQFRGGGFRAVDITCIAVLEFEIAQLAVRQRVQGNAGKSWHDFLHDIIRCLHNRLQQLTCWSRQCRSMLC